jgi:hypothetical protein
MDLIFADSRETRKNIGPLCIIYFLVVVYIMAYAKINLIRMICFVSLIKLLHFSHASYKRPFDFVCFMVPYDIQDAIFTSLGSLCWNFLRRVRVF